MKPNVIYVYADPYDDMVHLSKQELQELLEKAWEQGYYSQPYRYYDSYWPIVTTPAITCDQSKTNNPLPSMPTITCDTSTMTQEKCSTYTKSINDSIIFTASQADAQYGIGTNINN